LSTIFLTHVHFLDMIRAGRMPVNVTENDDSSHIIECGRLDRLQPIETVDSDRL
jgi:hypothetical protein